MSKRFNKFPQYLAEKIAERYGDFDSIFFEEDQMYYYKIPKELLINHRTKSREFKWYGDGLIVNYLSLGKVLWYLTELTQQEYFDIVVLGNVYPNKRPKCLNETCNNTIPWGRNLGENYRGFFCSRSCSSTYACNHLELYPDLKYRIDHQAEILNSPIYQTIEVKIKSHMYQFMYLGDPTDICYLYITWTKDNFIKFGVTYNPESRYIFSDVESSGKSTYRNMHIIYSSNRFNCAYFEALIKLKLYQSKEYLPDTGLHKLIKIIKEIIQEGIYNPFL